MSENSVGKTPEAVPEIVLPSPGSLVLSTSPHVQNGESISGIMLKVLICLMPAAAAAIAVFGLNALRVILYCTVFSMLFEYLWCRLTKQPQTLSDWSAAVTGVILAMNLPSGVPWWLCLIGAFFAIIIAKQVFGGLGQNPFNPAAAARVALLIGFAGPMTHWVKPLQGFAKINDLVTGATPLGTAKMAACTENAIQTFQSLETGDSLWRMFAGVTGGSLGETSALAIILGGIGLLACRLIKWQIPFAMLGTTALFTWIVHLANPALTPGPLFHLLSGGMMIGAFFMATDMVTSPMTNLGSFIFGAGIALIACVIRIWGGYPEGVSFAIVIMNSLVPLIDRLCYKHPFGWTSTSVSALNMRRGEVK